MALNNLLTVAQLPQSKALNNEIITSYVLIIDGSHEDRYLYNRYESEDIIKYIRRGSAGTLLEDCTESTYGNGNTYLTNARYNVHQNIPSGEKIYDVWIPWLRYQDHIWALMRLY